MAVASRIPPYTHGVFSGVTSTDVALAPGNSYFQKCDPGPRTWMPELYIWQGGIAYAVWTVENAAAAAGSVQLSHDQVSGANILPWIFTHAGPTKPLTIPPNSTVQLFYFVGIGTLNDGAGIPAPKLPVAAPVAQFGFKIANVGTVGLTAQLAGTVLTVPLTDNPNDPTGPWS